MTGLSELDFYTETHPHVEMRNILWCINYTLLGMFTALHGGQYCNAIDLTQCGKALQAH